MNHSLPARRLLAALALALVGTGALAAPPRLQEPDVKAFMQEVAAASQARDVERIGNLMSADCVVVFSDQAGHVAGELTRESYLSRLREGTTALGDVAGYRYQMENLRVQLTADARQAIVDADVTEALRYNERDIVTHSHEASVVERRDGVLKLVKVTGTVKGTSR